MFDGIPASASGTRRPGPAGFLGGACSAPIRIGLARDFEGPLGWPAHRSSGKREDRAVGVFPE